MAVWQIDFYLIPRRAIASQGAVNASDLPAAHWWTAYTLPAHYQDRLSAAAGPMVTSPSGDVATWGSPDGNRIDVWSKDGRVSSVIVRVDARKLDSKFGAALIQFVRASNAVLVRGDGLVVEPKIANYAAAIRGSNAWKVSGEPSTRLRRDADTDDDDA